MKLEKKVAAWTEANLLSGARVGIDPHARDFQPLRYGIDAAEFR
jgi:hypothetical protein